MNREEIQNIITQFRQALTDNKTVEINAMMVNQNNQRKTRYKGLMLKIASADLKPIVINALDYIEQELARKSLSSYDLEVSVDDVIQTEEKQRVVHGEEILQNLSVNLTEQNTVQEDTDLSKIGFVVIQLYYQGKSLFLFQKYTQPSVALRTAERFIFSGGQLKPCKEKILTLNYVVDAFLFEDAYYILNRNTFNSMFAYKDVFKRIIEDNASVIQNSGLMQNADQFITDCETDGRYLTRLTKVVFLHGFQKVTENKMNLRKVISDYNLSLEVSEKDEIIYRNKSDVSDILNLLLRHFVVDAITSDKMIAMAIQDYKVEK